MYISDVCKEQRKQTKLSNNEISEKSGIPLNTINKFMSVGSKAPSVYTVGPICRVLGVSLDEYFGIISPDMSKEEKERVAEAYEKNKVELEQTIERQVEQATSREEVIKAKDKTIEQMEDRISYQKKAIFWLRIGIAAAIVYALLLDILNPIIGLIRY